MNDEIFRIARLVRASFPEECSSAVLRANMDDQNSDFTIDYLMQDGSTQTAPSGLDSAEALSAGLMKLRDAVSDRDGSRLAGLTLTVTNDKKLNAEFAYVVG